MIILPILGQDKFPVITDSDQLDDGTFGLRGTEGVDLVITCTSEYDVMILMYDDQTVNETVLINETYSVNFTRQMGRDDDGKSILCQAFNSSDGEYHNTTATFYLNCMYRMCLVDNKTYFDKPL